MLTEGDAIGWFHYISTKRFWRYGVRAYKEVGKYDSNLIAFCCIAEGLFRPPGLHVLSFTVVIEDSSVPCSHFA